MRSDPRRAARPFDAVLFDLDGVLVDSRRAFATCLGAALLEHGVAVPPDERLHAFIGPPLQLTVAELLEDAGADPRLLEPCIERYRAIYRERAAELTSIVTGIPELLERLGRELPLVVATSKPQALAEPLLLALGLRAHFGAVLGPSLATTSETKGATVRRALLELPTSTSAVMIGDREHDVIGARENGIPCIGVLWGIGSATELTSAGATALVADPAQLAALLAGS